MGKFDTNLNRMIQLDKLSGERYCWLHLFDIARCHSGEKRSDYDEVESLKSWARKPNICKEDEAECGRCYCGKFKSAAEDPAPC